MHQLTAPSVEARFVMQPDKHEWFGNDEEEISKDPAGLDVWP
jgi:hypothetical protein